MITPRYEKREQERKNGDMHKSRKHTGAPRHIGYDHQEESDGQEGFSVEYPRVLQMLVCFRKHNIIHYL